MVGNILVSIPPKSMMNDLPRHGHRLVPLTITIVIAIVAVGIELEEGGAGFTVGINVLAKQAARTQQQTDQPWEVHGSEK